MLDLMASFANTSRYFASAQKDTHKVDASIRLSVPDIIADMVKTYGYALLGIHMVEPAHNTRGSHKNTMKSLSKTEDSCDNLLGALVTLLQSATAITILYSMIESICYEALITLVDINGTHFCLFTL